MHLDCQQRYDNDVAVIAFSISTTSPSYSNGIETEAFSKGTSTPFQVLDGLLCLIFCCTHELEMMDSNCDRQNTANSRENIEKCRCHI